MNKQKTDWFPIPVNPDRVLVNNLNVESVVNELGDILFGSWGSDSRILSHVHIVSRKVHQQQTGWCASTKCASVT